MNLVPRNGCFNMLMNFDSGHEPLSIMLINCVDFFSVVVDLINIRHDIRFNINLEFFSYFYGVYWRRLLIHLYLLHSVDPCPYGCCRRRTLVDNISMYNYIFLWSMHIFPSFCVFLSISSICDYTNEINEHHVNIWPKKNTQHHQQQQYKLIWERQRWK